MTLVETLVAVGILGLVITAMIYGNVQSTRQAEWSSMSLMAQSLALESVEQARAAQWPVYTSGSGTTDERPPGTYVTVFSNLVLCPLTGQRVTVTNTLQITTVGSYPPVRQISAACVWQYPPGQWFTNTVITLRGGS